MTKTPRAEFIEMVDGFNGEALLYRVDPPVEFSLYGEQGEEGHSTKYLVLSAVIAPYSGPEVLAFPASEDGEVWSWSEAFGTRGDLNHVRCLEEAGYTVTPFGAP